MDSQWQTVFNWAFGAINILIGVVLKIFWDSLSDLRKDDKALSEKIHAIETLVAGKYVTWDGFQTVISGIEATLRRIEDKLDHKADK